MAELTRQDYINKIEALKVANPEAWANAHTGNDKTEDFVRIVAYELNKVNPDIGLNGKRGDPDNISDDALSVKNPNGFDFDPTDNNNKRDVIDFIESAGDVRKAKVTWGVVKAADGNPTGSAWVKPTKPTKVVVTPVVPQPVEPPKPKLKDRDTFFREMRELNEFYASTDGLKRPGGMVINEKADIEALASWGYNFIVEGWTVERAKEEIRKSFEWRAKH